MIFVTVGTHEQQFNRLVQCVDSLKEKGIITEDVMIQTGFSTYEPKFCAYSQWVPYEQMLEYVRKARIVVTHGGPSSFIMPLQVGKIPVVVPRKKEMDEHVNDHQLTFCLAVAQRQKNILVVEDIDTLGDVLTNYDALAAEMTGGMESNNARFCAEFGRIVEELVK